MKINIVTGFFLPVPPISGGSSEKVWHRLSQLFAAAGHEVTFISRQWPGFADNETIAGVRHIRLKGARHTSSLPLNLWRDLRWGWRVTRALPAADVTICNTVSLPIWLRRLKPSTGAVVPVVARMPKGHGRFYGATDLLLSLSEAVTQALLAENPRLSGRIAAFPYPIDYQLLERAAATHARTDGTVNIGYIGRVHPEKGLSLLLKAVARLATQANLPAWRLIITGPVTVEQGGGGESYVDALRKDFCAALQGRVEFRSPEFDPVRLASCYADLDIFCYPSIAESGETFGVAVAEAMAARCAPVVSGLPCFRGLIVPEQNGLVFDHRAESAENQLATALTRLLVSETFRREIGLRAQSHVRTFDFAAVSQVVLKDLAAVVEKRQRA